MKLEARRLASFLKQPDLAAKALLLYGPDQGLVRERAARLVQAVVPDLKDPFRIAELTWADLTSDPARLSDEANALAFGGGRRAVRVRPPGSFDARAFESYLEDAKGEALIVAEAGDLAKSSALRKLFEAAPNAYALACYQDEAEGLSQLVVEVLREAGLKVEPDAEDYIVHRLGPDRALNRRELEKLALYVGGAGRSVDLKAAQAVIGDSAEVDADEVCDAAADGNVAALDEALGRAFGAGESAVGLLRRVIQHFQKLHFVAGLAAEGTPIESAMARLRPPLFFRRQGVFKGQVRRWNRERTERALDILLEAEIGCKSTGARDQALCAHALLRIANAARR